MRYAMPMALTVIMMIFTGFTAAARDGEDTVPATTCKKDLIRQVWDGGDGELKDAVRRHFVDKDKQGGSDSEFCIWLEQRINGETEAGFRACPGGCDNVDEDPVPETPEVVRSVPPDVRQRIREVADTDTEVRPQSTNNKSSFLNSPFVGGLAGGFIGGLLGGMLYNKFSNSSYQQPQYFPQPQWRPPWGQPGYPGMMPGMQPPGMMPYMGGQAPGVLPYGNQPQWAMPYGNQFGNAPWATNYGGMNPGYNAYPGAAPAVLPLAPQPYSVMGTIPQNHWNLINVGR